MPGRSFLMVNVSPESLYQVWIGGGAIVVGPCTIGNGVTVAGGAVVCIFKGLLCIIES